MTVCTLTEAAAVLRVSTGNLARLVIDMRISPLTPEQIIAQGHIPAFRVGRQWRIQGDHLEQYAARRKANP